jgi:hypothetical protein
MVKLEYVNIGLAGTLVLVLGALHVVAVGNAAQRSEMIGFQRVTESLQSKLVAKRQVLQSQQERLNKGSAIAENIGPAVLADISAAAEKNSNPKLKELLQKYGVRAKGVPAGAQGAAKPGNTP